MSRQQTPQEILKDVLDNYNDLNLSKNYRFEDITKYTAERNMEDLGRYGFTHTFSDKDNVLMLKTLRLSWDETKSELKSACDLVRKLHHIDKNHENVPHIRGFLFDSNTNREYLRLIFDYIPGQWSDLSKFLEENPPSEKLFPIILGAARGLEAMHDKEIVLDWILPTIITLNKEKALILGVPTKSVEKNTTIIHWSAPEAFRGSNPSINSNVWQFGMVLYACISKKIPYHGVRPFEACIRIQNYQKPEAPSKMTPFEDKLWEICEKCWSKPDGRPTMSDIIESLVSINDEFFLENNGTA